MSSNEDIGFEYITLPQGYEYSNFCKLGTSEYHFYCKDLKRKDEIKKWVRLFSEKTFVEWSIARTYPRRQRYRIDCRCHYSYSQYKPKESIVGNGKSPKCPAWLIIKQVLSGNDNSITKIILNHDHNHPLETIVASLEDTDVDGNRQETKRLLVVNDHSRTSNLGLEHLKLPEGYEYTNFRKPGASEYHFYCNDLITEDEIKNWVRLFGNKTFVEWRIARTYPRRQHYRIDCRCQHSSSKYQLKEPTRRNSKSTKCLAFLTIKQAPADNDNIFTKIILKHDHNHALGTTTASLKYRDVSEHAKETLRRLFRSGHSPSSAHQTMQFDTFVEYGHSYFFKVAEDRKHIPNLMYCYNLFYKEFKEKDDSLSSGKPADFFTLSTKLHEWTNKCGGRAVVKTYNNDIIVCIMTPLMQRVHTQILQSGELMFLDASGHCDRAKHKSYLLYTHCDVDLPLGYIITSSTKQDTFEAALKEFCSLDMDNIGFFGRGSCIGPQTIITDDDLSKRKPVEKLWPSNNILLCTIYVLRTVWLWLSKTQNGIDSIDQPILFLAFKKIMTAGSCENALEAFTELQYSETGRKYITFCEYIANVWWPVKESWCVCYRKNHTNEYIDYAMRGLKDIILLHTKTYSIVQLVDLIITRLDKYYSLRIADFANGRVSVEHLTKFLPDAKDISCESIILLENGNFIIKDVQQDDYIVDINLGLCTCHAGLIGVFCEHQSAAILYNGKHSCNSPTRYSAAIRQKLFEVCTGEELPLSRFSDTEEQIVVLADHRAYNHQEWKLNAKICA